MFNSHTVFNSPSVFTTSDVPGRAIEASFGAVGVYAHNLIVTGGQVTSAIAESMDELLKKSTELGGNAVVGVRFESWMSAYVILGTAVRLSNPTP